MQFICAASRVSGQHLARPIAPPPVHPVQHARRQARFMTTVQPAASVGAIFQVDGMDGVFEGG